MKLHIGDKVYPWNGTSGVPLIHLIRMQREVGIGQQELSLMQKEHQAKVDKHRAAVEIAKREGTDAPDDPGIDVFLFGLMVWLTRLAAGEKTLTFEDACDFDVSLIEFELEPGDKADEDVDPTSLGEKPTGAAVKSRPRVVDAA